MMRTQKGGFILSVAWMLAGLWTDRLDWLIFGSALMLANVTLAAAKATVDAIQQAAPKPQCLHHYGDERCLLERDHDHSHLYAT